MAEKKPNVGLPVGTKIGKYEVRERLGIGGQAIVYKCHDPLLDRDVAIKQISSHLAEDAKFVEQFRREAQILAKLGAEQPGIVTIHELVEDERGLFIVMEYVSGHSLETILQQNTGPFDAKATLQIIWRLAGALNAVHKTGIIHRDIKPGNIMVADGLRAKITDFGVAASMTGQASMPLGTTKYMAPELFEGGEVDGRADMYSLGFIAYEMLVGRQKFSDVFADVVRDPASEVLRWMKWHGNRSVSAPPAHQVNADVPEDLSRIVAKMTAKGRDERYASMEKLGKALRACLISQTRPAPQPAGAQPAGTGLEAADLKIQMPEAPGQAPEAAEGAEAEAEAEAAPGEGPATARVPRKRLSRKTKLILAGAAGGLLIIFGVFMLVRTELRKGSLERQREIIYKRAEDAYKAALPRENNQAKFESALKDFSDLQKRFGGTKEAAEASVLAHMCRAYLAAIAENWETSSSEKRRAEEQCNEVQAKWDNSPDWPSDDYKRWLAERRFEINSFEDYLTDSRRFMERLVLGQVISGAVDQLDGLWKLAVSGKASEVMESVVVARRLLTEAGNGTKDACGKYALTAAGNLAEAEDKLRALGQTAPTEEIRAIVSEAKRKIVPLAREMLDGKLREYSSTTQHDEAVGSYRAWVESAENAVKGELARERMLADQRKKDEWAQRVEQFKAACQNQMNRAVELATEGKIDQAREALKGAGKARNDLLDLPLPAGLYDRHLDELKELRKGTLVAMDKAIKQTESRVNVAEKNWERDTEFARAIEAADLARAKGDKRSELASLQRAVRLKPDAREGLQGRMNKVQLAIELETALGLKRDGRNREAAAALEDYLKRDPKNRVAKAALEEVRGLVKRADLVAKADALMEQGKYAEAIPSLEEAAKIHRDEMVSQRLAECKYRKGMADADALAAEGKYDEAIKILREVLAVKPSVGPVISERLQKLEQALRCSELCIAGDEAVAKRKWLAARRKYGEALKIAPDDKLRERAQAGVHKATFEEWVAMGQSQMAQGAARAALAYFKNAQKHAKTPEEKSRLKDLIERASRVLDSKG